MELANNDQGLAGESGLWLQCLLQTHGSLPLGRCCVMVPLETLLGTRGISGALPVSLTSQPSEESASREFRWA